MHREDGTNIYVFRSLSTSTSQMQKRIDWLPDFRGKATTQSEGGKPQLSGGTSRSQPQSCGVDAELTLSTRKRVPGFRIGVPNSGSHSKAGVPVMKSTNSARRGKSTRGMRKHGAGGSIKPRKTPRAEPHDQAQTHVRQQQVREGVSERLRPCGECRTQVSLPECHTPSPHVAEECLMSNRRECNIQETGPSPASSTPEQPFQ